jgi:subtilisin family serine protease
VHHDTFELTRLHAACRGQPAGRDTPRPSAPACDSIATAYREKSQEVNGTLRQILGIEGAFTNASTALAAALGAKPTPASVRAFTPTSPALEQSKRLFLQLAANGLDEEALAEAKAAYGGQSRYGLDTLYQPRGAADTTGSRDVMGPDALHGTHVAGIIGAARAPGNAVQGIAPAVQLMAVRVVPDGDERDEDVARAIRYAVDQGAQILNMSFGKSYSPRKPVVDEAVRYAVSKGVLLVHAAGNDGANNDIVPSFPTSVLQDGSRAATWIEVGASTRHADQRLPAGFSNYGASRVDLFAPGDAILSTAPGGGTKRESGTSMAAPVVSGVAALLMAYFPELTAVQVKALLVETARRFPGLEVETPGSGEKVAFAKLSASGGVIDAYAAVKAAMEREIRK